LVAATLIIALFFRSAVRGFPVSHPRNLLESAPKACTFIRLTTGERAMVTYEVSPGAFPLYGLIAPVLVALLYALAQDMIFRGLAWHTLERAGLRTALVNFIQAYLYAFPYHKPNLIGGLVLLVFGLWLGWWRARDGNILTATWLHFIALALVSGGDAF
jgi:hypothetical protein